jgi:hypothetical protein
MSGKVRGFPAQLGTQRESLVIEPPGMQEVQTVADEHVAQSNVQATQAPALK